MMIAKKEDWSFEKKLLYKNKQGQNKAIPAETTVLMVKDLSSYIMKMAASESADMENLSIFLWCHLLFIGPESNHWQCLSVTH